jgi:hypothetical protein
LNLDVARNFDEFLNEHDLVPERLPGFSLCRLELRVELAFCHGDAHSFASATSNGLPREQRD